MTVTTDTARADYTASAILATYAYGFKVLDEDDLEVIVRDAGTGVETTMVRGTHYNVTGVGLSAGGTVVFTGAANLADGDHITIIRYPSFLQQTDIRNLGRYMPDLHETAFDLGAMRDQWLKSQMDSAMRLPVTVNPADVSASLPVPEANKYLAWSSDGSKLVNKATTDGGISQTDADARYGLRVEPIEELGNMGSAKTVTGTVAKNRFHGSLDNAALALTIAGIADAGYMELHFDTATTGCAITWAAPDGQTIQHMSGGGVAPTLPSASGESVSFVIERVGTKLKVYQTGASA